MPCDEIAIKANTSVGYVYKILSEARKVGKVLRGRSGRLFAHGKVWYEYWAPRSWVECLDAPVVNPRTGMVQVGFKSRGDPCSVQIHKNGRIIIWVHSIGWREWLLEELVRRGWREDWARTVAYHSMLNLRVVEAGVKPVTPDFIPKDFYLKTEWGVIICRDDSPEKSVLELRLSIPDMQRYLGLPDIQKRLELIERGMVSIGQRQRTLEALLLKLVELIQRLTERVEKRECWEGRYG